MAAYQMQHELREADVRPEAHEAEEELAEVVVVLDVHFLREQRRSLRIEGK